MSLDFIHLRVHSEYSIEDGLILAQELPKHVAEQDMPAVALTDLNNCFALVKFYENARKQGIKPILGCELRVRAPSKYRDEEYTELVLLVCNDNGYRNLCTLVSDMWESYKETGEQILPRELLKRENTEGLIALSGGRNGEVGMAIAHTPDEAGDCLKYWLDIFGDRFYLEVQRLGHPGEDEYLHAVRELGATQQCPLVATNHVCFVKESDYDMHEARVRIHDKRTLEDGGDRRHTAEQYLKSAAQMCELFADMPEVLQNSVEIAKRCNAAVDLGSYHLPKYAGANDDAAAIEMLRTEAKSGLQERLKQSVDPDMQPEQAYFDRLEAELKVIEKAGFSTYFLVVMDFVRWALGEGIPVGPGRGSGAGSVVAWSLNITDVDPLRYGLLFERFLNAERIGLPDFDIDFCQERRDQVMEYVRQHYGEDKVAGIVTFNRMAGRAVVRHVARVQSKPYAVGDRLSSAMPNTPGMTMEEMLKQDQQGGGLNELTRMLADDEEVKEVWDMSLALEGLVHNVGRHAGGIVIAPDKLLQFSPLCYPADADFAVTHYDKDDIESVGLVKFDFLGLRTLTVIDKAERAINRDAEKRPVATGEIVNVSEQPLDDPLVYALLREANSIALFQLESEGMRDLLLRYQPTKFDDLVVLISLYRPGPLGMGMHTDYVERRKGNKAIDYYDVAALEPVLENTYGVFLYQEQVMESARVLAKFTLGEADILRRAMGKKKPEEMKQQRERFVEGATGNNLSNSIANKVFDVMEEFSGYGFNKSHAVAYALIAYRTAWLKVHYGPWFMAAEMSTILTNTDALEKLMRECKRMQIGVIAPDINRSTWEFEVDTESGNIVYALGAIKGIGQKVAETISEEREAGGNYKDMLDFCIRMNAKEVNCNQGMLEVLVCAGCFDSFEESRPVLMGQVERVLNVVKGRERIAAGGGGELFGGNEDNDEQLDYVRNIEQSVNWTPVEQLTRERSVLGLYLSGHPLNFYGALLKERGCVRIKSLRDHASDEGVWIAGSVDGVAKIRRNTTVVLNLSDGSGMIEVRMDSQRYERYQELAVEGKVLMVYATIKQNEYSTADYGLSAEPIKIEEINTESEDRPTEVAPAPEQAALNGAAVNGVAVNGAEHPTVLTLTIDGAEAEVAERIRSLKMVLGQAARGSDTLRIHYQHPDAEVHYDWPDGIAASEELLSELRRVCGADSVLQASE